VRAYRTHRTRGTPGEWPNSHSQPTGAGPYRHVLLSPRLHFQPRPLSPMTAPSARPAWHAPALGAFVATVLGREADIGGRFTAALRAGAPIAELTEVALMAHLFCGFPRAIQGLRALDGALGCSDLPTPHTPNTGAPNRGAISPANPIAGKPGIDAAEGASARTTVGPADTAQDCPTADSGGPAGAPVTRRMADRANGERLFRQIYGETADAVLHRLAKPAPTFVDAVLEDAYGRILSRPGMAPADREWFAIAALAALDCPPQLKSHLLGAVRLGVPLADLAALPDLLRSELTSSALAALTTLLSELRGPQ